MGNTRKDQKRGGSLLDAEKEKRAMILNEAFQKYWRPISDVLTERKLELGNSYSDMEKGTRISHATIIRALNSNNPNSYGTSLLAVYALSKFLRLNLIVTFIDMHTGELYKEIRDEDLDGLSRVRNYLLKKEIAMVKVNRIFYTDQVLTLRKKLAVNIPLSPFECETLLIAYDNIRGEYNKLLKVVARLEGGVYVENFDGSGEGIDSGGGDSSVG